MGYSMSTVAMPPAVQALYDAYLALSEQGDHPEAWSAALERWWEAQRAHGLDWHRSYTAFANYYLPVMVAMGMTFDPQFDPVRHWLDMTPEERAIQHEYGDRHPAIEDYNRRLDQAVLARRFEHPGIPLFKINTGSDGYLVFPDEIRSALRLYEEHGGRERAVTLYTALGGDAQNWDEWVAFLTRAADFGGFRVR